MIKAVFFDMDGVLIDAKEWHYEALNRALELFGYKISRESHLSTFDGLPTKKKLDMLHLTRGLPKGLHKFLNDLKQNYTMEYTSLYCKPVFQHQKTLSKLKQRGYKLAVCSNSVRNTVTTMMRLSHLDEYLDLQVSNEDVVQAKPSPEIYLYALRHFDLEPEECLIIEDNEHGIQAARASGAHLMTVSGPEDVTYEAVSSWIDSIELGSGRAGAARKEM